MIAELVLAGALAAPPPVRFGFDATSANPGERVVLRIDGLRSRRAVRLYLVERSQLRRIRTAGDARLWFVAIARPRRGRAIVPFFVPPADSGTYVPWCAGCGKRVTRALEITLPRTSCAATTPNGLGPRGFAPTHGNRLLSTAIPSFSSANVNTDGTISHKLYWFAATGNGDFSVSGRRLDTASPPLDVRRINRGTDGRSWAAPVAFPTRGCWRVRARLVDYYGRWSVDIAYVVNVDPR